MLAPRLVENSSLIEFCSSVLPYLQLHQTVLWAFSVDEQLDSCLHLGPSVHGNADWLVLASDICCEERRGGVCGGVCVCMCVSSKSVSGSSSGNRVGGF